MQGSKYRIQEIKRSGSRFFVGVLERGVYTVKNKSDLYEL